MKVRKLSVLLVLLLAVSYMVQAQDYDFRVFVNKGANEVKAGGGSWASLKTGTKLKDGEEIKIVDDGYLGLVHSSGKTQELKSAGTYDVTTLSSGVVVGSKNIATKYADFVLSKMSPEEKEQNRRKYASVTGAVERGDDDASINLFMPTSVSIYNSSAIIRWEPVKENATYQVKLKNIFEEVIMVAETKDTYYSIDFNDPKIANAAIENLVIVKVFLKDNEDIKSKDAAIERITKEDEPEFSGELSDLKSSLGGTETSINDLILAEFYEENGLMLDALTSYENSIKLSPDVPYYQEAYDEFLLRTGLK
jgi:hypothetical protein